MSYILAKISSFIWNHSIHLETGDWNFYTDQFIREIVSNTTFDIEVTQKLNKEKDTVVCWFSLKAWAHHASKENTVSVDVSNFPHTQKSINQAFIGDDKPSIAYCQSCESSWFNISKATIQESATIGSESRELSFNNWIHSGSAIEPKASAASCLTIASSDSSFNILLYNTQY